MRHGIDGYFDEIARFERRTFSLIVSVACALLLALLIARRPEIVAALNDPKRFGFEGREQLVQRILLEQVSQRDQPGNSTANVVPVELHRGGGAKHSRPDESGLKPEQKVNGKGIGEDPLDLQSRLRALALDAPVVRSEDLIVERLVRPDYPEDMHEKNIEGAVELVALVDTTGEVREVHIVGGDRNPSFDRAATDAVLQCRYRPYTLHASKERVWAYYRVAFSLY